MLPQLNQHEQQVVKFIENYLRRFFRPPSFEEIGRAVGLSSKDHVYRELESIEEKGYIAQQRGISRGIRLLYTAAGFPFSFSTLHIPLIGRIVAGQPIPVPHSCSPPFGRETIEVPCELLIPPSASGRKLSQQEAYERVRQSIKEQGAFYALQVEGNSMVDAMIGDGDVVVMRHQRKVENGETAAMWLKEEGETTLKSFYSEGERIRLKPANDDYDEIYVEADKVGVQGKVVAVIRRLS